MTEEKELEYHTPPLVDSVMEKEEATEKYLREEWPVEEGEVFSDLGEVEEAAKTLENTTEGGEKEDISLCVRRAAGEPYQEFIFSGQYENKKERKEQLRTTLQHIGFAVGDNSTKGLLCLGKTLNQNEERGLLEGFKGKHFFYMAKICQLEKDMKSDGFVFSKWENKNDTQPRLDDDTKVSGEEEGETKFTLFGETFHLKCTNAVKAAIFESIAFLQCEEETFQGLSVCNWSSAHNHARYRVAKHLLDCNQREAFVSFCIRQFPKKRQRDKGEEKYEKKKKRTNPSRAAPSSIASVSTETHGAVEEKVGEREDVPEWLREEYETLHAETVTKASNSGLIITFFFRTFKYWFGMPALYPDKDSLKEVVAQMYQTHGEEAMFMICDWHCNSTERFTVYASKKMRDNYYENGVKSSDRLIYYEKIPPWKTFPKLLRYEEITLNIVLKNVDGESDDLIASGKRINERYSYALFKLKKEKEAAPVEETPMAHHCAPPSGAPPPVEEAIEIVEPEEPAPQMERRNASVTRDVPEGEYRGRKILKEYKETWQARNLPVQIKWKTLVALFFILTVVTYGGAVIPEPDIPYLVLMWITIGIFFLFFFLSTHFKQFVVPCAALILYLMWLSGNDSRLSQLGERDAFLYDWVLHRYHWVIFIACVIASRISKWLSFVVLVGAIVSAAVFLNWAFVARFALFIPLWKCYREEVSNPFTIIVVPHRDVFVFMISFIACVRCGDM